MSQSALASVLAELRELGEIPDACSRSSLKRARDEDMAIQTPYGDLMQTVPIDMKNGSQRQFSFIHPLALIYHLCAVSLQFKEFMSDKLRETKCGWNKQWSIIVYGDEVGPGNALKHYNKRKLHCVYYTFAELGTRALTSEWFWFTLVVCRSSVIEQIDGGVGAFYAAMLQTFFGRSANFTTSGVLIGSCMLYATLEHLISDMDEYKHMLDLKGHNGLFPCLFCKNIAKKASDLDGIAEDVRTISETDIGKCKFWTDAGRLAAADILHAQKPILNTDDFDKLEMVSGLNYAPKGLLLCKPLRSMMLPIKLVMFDWMHTYLVGGIWNTEMENVLKALAPQIKSTDLHAFFNDFTWPACFGSWGGKLIFEKRSNPDKAEKFKCSASEGLSSYALVRTFLSVKVLGKCSQYLDSVCHCYFALANVLDLLLSVGRVYVCPGKLQYAIRAHLERHKAVYGEAGWVPKMHYALHLPVQLESHGTLWSCFLHETSTQIEFCIFKGMTYYMYLSLYIYIYICISIQLARDPQSLAKERKHKEAKRHGNNMSNTSSDEYDATIMKEIVHQQVTKLCQDNILPSDTAFLTMPRKASKLNTQILQGALGTSAAVYMSVEARCHGGLRCHINDVVAVQVGDTTNVAEVLFHCQADGVCLSYVQVYKPSGRANVFKRSDERFVVDSYCIVETFIFRKLDESFLLVVPFRTWAGH